MSFYTSRLSAVLRQILNSLFLNATNIQFAEHLNTLNDIYKEFLSKKIKFEVFKNFESGTYKPKIRKSPLVENLNKLEKILSN